MNTKVFSKGCAAMALALMGAASHNIAVAQEAYFTHPASCVAPFLFQAERMRWHEHFLMNPPDGQRTWAVCPINMYIDDVATAVDGGVWLIQVGLQDTSDAVMTPPRCFYTVHSILNKKWAGFINGDDLTYTQEMTLGVDNGITFAQGLADVDDIVDDLGTAAAAAPFHLSVYCRLDPGWGINGVEVLEVDLPAFELPDDLIPMR